MNVYQYPENHRLKIISVFEREPQWDFNMHVIFKHEDTNKVYYAHDSGCSCPTPFEDFSGIDDMEEITKEGFESFSSMIMREDYGTVGEKREFLDKVKLAFQ